MFTAKKILDYNDSENRLKEMERNKDRLLLSSGLNLFDKVTIIKANKSINKIIKKITKNYYWDYTDGIFTYKSDFKYDSSISDITFTINKIQKVDGKYILSDNATDRERVFYENNQDLLNELAEKENEKEKIYEKNKDLIGKELEKTIKSTNNVTNAYMTSIAQDFSNCYGEEGIKSLIYILNRLDDIKDPMTVYSVLVKNGNPKSLKKDLLTWISTYSNPGKDLIDKYYEEYVYKNQNYKKPNLEEIQANNMINLHLY